MEKKEKTVELEDGSFVTYGNITTTPEDGFVSNREIHPQNPPLYDDIGKFHNGYSWHFTMTTDNPYIIISSFFVIASLFGLGSGVMVGKELGFLVFICVFVPVLISEIRYLIQKKKNTSKKDKE